MTCTSKRARSRCARNSCPSPAPSLAPSIRPGTSATTSWRSSESTVPSTGWMVVNGYAATFGVAFEIRRRSDDLPAFGSPTSAASASSFRRSSYSASSPGRPVSAKRGVWRVDVANRRLPRPPKPPEASTTRLPGCARSATSWSSASKTCVPTGTRSSTVSPAAPCLPEPPPPPPRPAAKRRRERKAERSRRSGLATATTSPPGPPSPPSGPPFGTYFSRRKLSAPSPPRPACTWMRARSWNTRRYLVGDGDEAALAACLECDRAVALREDRVVAPDARAGARPETRAALADDDRPRRHALAVEDLDAEHLRVRVAAVPRRAESLFVSHLAVLPL